MMFINKAGVLTFDSCTFILSTFSAQQGKGNAARTLRICLGIAKVLAIFFQCLLCRLNVKFKHYSNAYEQPKKDHMVSNIV